MKKPEDNNLSTKNISVGHHTDEISYENLLRWNKEWVAETLKEDGDYFKKAPQFYG
jgi:carbonic anhydrase